MAHWWFMTNLQFAYNNTATVGDPCAHTLTHRWLDKYPINFSRIILLWTLANRHAHWKSWLLRLSRQATHFTSSTSSCFDETMQHIYSRWLSTVVIGCGNSLWRKSKKDVATRWQLMTLKLRQSPPRARLVRRPRTCQKLSQREHNCYVRRSYAHKVNSRSLPCVRQVSVWSVRIKYLYQAGQV